MAAQIKYNFTMSEADIDRGIPSVGRRSRKIRTEMHCLAVSTLFRWMETGNVQPVAARATEMLKEFDPSFAQKIVNWFAVHAGLVLQDDDTFRYAEDKTTISKEEVVAAKDETMFDLTPDAAPEAYDLRAKVLNLIKQAENKRTKGLKDDDNVPADMIAGLKELIGDDNS